MARPTPKGLGPAALRPPARPARADTLRLDGRGPRHRPVPHLPLGRAFDLARRAALGRAAFAGGAGAAPRQGRHGARLTQPQARRELLHDAEEGLLGFDCISPLKPFLGAGFAALQTGSQARSRCATPCPPGRPRTKRAHKSCDIALAAAEAVHVAGWTREEVRGTLGIRAAVMAADPLAALYDSEPWRPWPPELAAERFLAALKRLSPRHDAILPR